MKKYLVCLSMLLVGLCLPSVLAGATQAEAELEVLQKTASPLELTLELAEDGIVEEDPAAAIAESAVPADDLLPNQDNLIYYNQLTETQQVVYQRLYISMTSADPYAKVSVSDLSISVDDSYLLLDVLYYLKYEFPELFFVGGMSYSYYPSTWTFSTITPTSLDSKVDGGSALTTDAVSNMTAEIEAAAEAFLEDIPYGTDAQVALAIHDKMIAEYSYDYEVVKAADAGEEDTTETLLGHTIYNMLVKKTAVCDGYALTYTYLLAKRGIVSSLVTSTDHAWNVVKLSDDYYEVDVTWDDVTMEENQHNCFNITSAEMSTYDSHTPTWNISTDPLFVNAEGTHFVYSYLKGQNGLELGSTNTLGDDIALALAIGDDASPDLQEMLLQQAFTVKMVAFDDDTLYQMDQLIWDVAVTPGDASTLEVTHTWTAEEPYITVQRSTYRLTESDVIDLVITYDNGATGTLSASFVPEYNTKGDISQDGAFSIADAIALMQNIENETFSFTQQYNADWNEDYTFDEVVDVQLLFAALIDNANVKA